MGFNLNINANGAGKKSIPANARITTTGSVRVTTTGKIRIIT